MTHLLDTDHLSILQWKESAEQLAIVANVNLHGPDNVAACIASFHEQAMGANNRINQAKDQEEVVRGYDLFSKIVANFREFTVLPFDAAAAQVFRNLKAQKVRVSTMDLRIAAIGLSRGLTVVTRNVADFGKVPGLVTADWTK